jgi:hypothetical protein
VHLNFELNTIIMIKKTPVSRRVAVKSSIAGLLGISFSNTIFGNNAVQGLVAQPLLAVSPRYPAIDESIVAEVVGVSHFNLDRLKQLVDPRPELARATWDWAFGDWETAIGAASHVGRKDIAAYLISKGARPDIFTFAMLGAYTTVKSMIEISPGVQRISGPHGISLLQHAKNGMSDKDTNKEESTKLIAYLQSLGDADVQQYLPMDDKDKPKYEGDYKYGEGATEGVTIKINSRKYLSLGKLGKNGGSLYKIGENKFIHNGTPSVIVSFVVENDKVLSLTIAEPGFTLTAKKG